MKYLYIFILAVTGWLLVDKLIVKGGPAVENLSIRERMREFGSNLHYLFGALAVIIIILFAVRFVFLALKSP